MARPPTPLNTPAPIAVRARPQPDGDCPVAVGLQGQWYPVAEIADVWRIDDEWWKAAEISRTYFDVQLVDGRRLVVFQDRIGGDWYQQRGQAYEQRP